MSDRNTFSLWDDTRIVSLQDLATRKCIRFRIKESGQFVIGRDASKCNLRIANDDYISGRHVCFYNEAGAIFLQDLNSTNGTKMNHVRISEKRRIQTGDILEIGKRQFQIRIE